MMKKEDYLQKLRDALVPYRNKLITHPVYSAINTLDDLRVFMEYHVYAVWDFMSLLKQLQRRLTCVSVPWVPIGDPLTRRLINDIVLAEESDVTRESGFASHYELYRRAMLSSGANVALVDTFVEKISTGQHIASALIESNIPDAAAEFISETWKTVQSDTHIVAAAFAFSREALIPDMFRSLVRDLKHHFPNELDLFYYYLERHISLDEDEHTPAAERMVQVLCADSEDKWNHAQLAMQKALEAREQLWNGILEALSSSSVLTKEAI